MPHTRRATLRFYAGVFLIAGATLVVQIAQTRILSVSSWYHLAFFVLSMAMFGLTAGAVWVYYRREQFTLRPLSSYLSANALLCAVTLPLALALQLRIPTAIAISPGAIVAWALLAIVLTCPFVLAGIVLSAALTRSPLPIGRVYGADLAGAAAGCLAALWLLSVTDAPSAMLWVAVAIACAGVLFHEPADGVRGVGATGAAIVRFRVPIVVILALAAFLNQGSAHGLRLLYVKGEYEPFEATERIDWNSFSRVSVYPAKTAAPALWGASAALPEALRVDARNLFIDGAAGTSMYGFSGDLGEVAFLKFDVTNLAYHLPERKKGAVIGVGGGRDVLSAKLFGLETVTGIELNPTFVAYLTRDDWYARYNRVASLPGVRLVTDEARSWMARSPESFDLIQMSLIDTWAATSAGALSLSENGLYTIEAWNLFLNRLAPGGAFTVSRWYAPGSINEAGRMISLAMGALISRGVADPAAHVYVAAVGQVATLVLARSPLTAADLAALDGAAAQYGYAVIARPGRVSPDATIAGILSSTSAEELASRAGTAHLDLSAPTDDRPFFFNQLKLRSFARGLGAREPGVVLGNLFATSTLLTIMLISCVLTFATIVFPLRGAIAATGRPLAQWGTAYFALIGLGFMLTEVALLQRLSIFLGHPVYSMSVVLFSMILSAGAGSLLSDVRPLASRAALSAWTLGTGAYLIGLSLWMPLALRAFDGAALPVRAAICVLLVAPAGALMGFGFPTGMRLAGAVDTGPTPWFWGINGATGVLAASAAVVVSLTFGIGVTLIAGGVCYVLLVFPALGLNAQASGRTMEPRPSPGA